VTTMTGTQAQVPDDSNHKPIPVRVPIFPKLASLLLESLDFAGGVPGLGVLYDLILSAVQQRKANEMPLTTLCIDHAVIEEKQAKALEKVVCDFRWDQDEVYYDDEEGDSKDSEFSD